MSTSSAVLVVLTFSLAAGPVAPAQVLRPPSVDGAAGGNFFQKDLAVGDVNGDGHPDLVATTADQTRLVLGTPDGAFGGAAPFLGGDGLSGCQLADLDGDGLVDVASAPLSSGVQVQLNQGGGVFGPARDLATTATVSTICIADLDADGDLDLAVGLYGQGRITIFSGDGAGGFAAGVDELAPKTLRIATGDVDGDGTLDLVAHEHKPYLSDDASAWVLRGAGRGVFESPVLVHPDMIDLAVADFSGDGIDDVAVTENQGDVVVHAGGPGLSLPVAFTLPAIGPAPLLATGDLDGDGLADLVQSSGTLLASHLGAPGGGLGPAIGGGCATNSFPLVLADLDRDGRLDAAVLHAPLGRVSAVLGNGDGSWRSSSLAPPVGDDPALADAAVADFDGDGRQDLVEAYASDARLRAGALDGSFGLPQPLGLGQDLLRTFADDSNQDGLLDLVVVRTTPFATPQGGVSLALGDGRLGFALQPQVTPFSKILEAEPADVDGDGRTDVLALLGNGLQIFRNVGDGGFTSLAVIGMATKPLDVDAADLDHDGDADLAVSYPGSGTSTLLIHRQTAGVFTQIGVMVMPGLKELLLHDVNADGHLDAVGVAQPASGFGSILIRLGAGDGSFGALQTFPLPSTTLGTIGLAELDGDAEAELLVGGTEETPVFVYDLVGGAPVFKEAHDCGLAPLRFIVADANGDGHDDVVLPTASVGALIELRNTLGPWTRLGFPVAGSAGDSLLVGEGTLLPGSPLRVSIVGMKPSTATLLIVGVSVLEAPFKGGVMVPTPTLILPIGLTNLAGDRTLTTTWPASLPSGFTVVMQAWQADAAGPAGFASTNGVRGVAP